MVIGKQEGIIIKSPEELAIMRKAGKVVAATLAALQKALKPGASTAELDAIALQEITKRDAIPSFKGYRGYPAHLCVSINDEVVHGIPSARVIHDGDIVGLDVGAIVDGFQGDAAVTVGVGLKDPKAQELVETARGALEEGIKAAKCGVRLGDVSAAIQSYVEARGFSVVREYVGHGIGRQMHEEPAVPNYGTPGRGLILQKGLVLALEPMVNMGDWRTKVKEDGWTVVTADGSLSAHFEHTIAITDGDAEVLTRGDSYS